MHRVRAPGSGFPKDRALPSPPAGTERSFTPAQLVEQSGLTFGHVGTAALREPNAKKEMATAPLKLDGQPVELVLVGELTTDGIAGKTFENEGKEKLTFGMRLTDPADEEAMTSLIELLEGVPDEGLDQWNVRSVLREGVLYLKVKTSRDGASYAFQSNMKLSPKKDGGELFQFMPVEVRVAVNCYFSAADDGAGLFFPLRRLDKQVTHKETSTQTETGEPKPPRGPSTSRRGNGRARD
jgi:hypothetical protein